uniref:Uncharacterized protein n=1 Tax=Megaselia scalaris TaxID=36166 RepID=T1GA36_MEGSC
MAEGGQIYLHETTSLGTNQTSAQLNETTLYPALPDAENLAETEDVRTAFEDLEKEAKSRGLHVNGDKTKYNALGPNV